MALWRYVEGWKQTMASEVMLGTTNGDGGGVVGESTSGVGGGVDGVEEDGDGGGFLSSLTSSVECR
jgi:hypothetical protein